MYLGATQEPKGLGVCFPGFPFSGLLMGVGLRVVFSEFLPRFCQRVSEDCTFSWLVWGVAFTELRAALAGVL